MPRVNIWLSEGLHKQVKDAGLPVSEIAQAALVAELDRLSHRHLSKPIAGQLAIEVPGSQQ